jgi:hypothetical protein
MAARMNQINSLGKRQPGGHDWADLIYLTRMKRDDERKWQSARSWLGGSPAIAADRWPRSAKTALPLHHLAQVNLAELPRGPNTPKLPPTGLLNFFADTALDGSNLDVAVVLSDEASTVQPSTPPADCPPLHGGNWFYHCKGAATAAEAPRVFRRWPIEFILLPASGRTYPDARERMVHIGAKPESIHIFAPGKLAHVQSGGFPWEAVRRVVDDFRHRVNRHAWFREYHPGNGKRVDPENRKELDSPEKHQARWQRDDRKLDVVRQFINYWSEQRQGHNLFAPIGTIVADALEQDIWALSRQQLRCRYGGGTTVLGDAASDVYRDMMVGPVELFARIPKDIRDYLLDERRRSGWGSSFHQMFGLVPAIQQSYEDFEDEVLLFSAGSDDMLSWLWGDVGVIHFLISPEDLAARKWDKVRGLFEGH